MTEFDRDSLDRVLPPARARADWDDVLRRAGPRRVGGRLVRVALVAAAGVVVVVGAASAFGTVRELILGTGVNSKIAFMHNTRKNCCPHELWIMNADGSDQRQITRLGAASFGPSWTPDGKRIIFSSNHHTDPKRGNFDLFLVNPDGSGLEQVTTAPTFDGFPMFSPDGHRLVWASNRHDANPHETNIFIADWVN